MRYTKQEIKELLRDESMETYIICMGYGEEPEEKLV